MGYLGFIAPVTIHTRFRPLLFNTLINSRQLSSLSSHSGSTANTSLCPSISTP